MKQEKVIKLISYEALYGLGQKRQWSRSRWHTGMSHLLTQLTPAFQASPITYMPLSLVDGLLRHLNILIGGVK